MWAVLLISKLVHLFFTHNLTFDMRGKELGFTDYVHFYLAGKITLSPLRDLFYSWEVQKQVLASITHCQIVDDFYTPYLPIVFIMMVPYSLLPIEVSHLLFDIINTTIGLAGSLLIIKYFGWQKNKMPYLILIGAIASMPSWNNWMLGQICWLYLGIISLYIVALFKKKDLLGALALALSIIKPQYAVFFAVPALCLKRFRLLLFAFLFELLFFAFSVLIFSYKAIITYPFVLNQNESITPSIHTQVMFCLRPMLEFFFSGSMAYRLCTLLALVALLAMIIVGFLVFRKKQNQNTLIWLTSLIVPISILFSPHAYSHDVIFLTLPALLTLPQKEFLSDRSITANLWRWLLILSPLLSWITFLLMSIGLPANFLFTTLIAALAICAFKQLWREAYI